MKHPIFFQMVSEHVGIVIGGGSAEQNILWARDIKAATVFESRKSLLLAEPDLYLKLKCCQSENCGVQNSSKALFILGCPQSSPCLAVPEVCCSSEGKMMEKKKNLHQRFSIAFWSPPDQKFCSASTEKIYIGFSQYHSRNSENLFTFLKGRSNAIVPPEYTLYILYKKYSVLKTYYKHIAIHSSQELRIISIAISESPASVRKRNFTFDPPIGFSKYSGIALKSRKICLLEVTATIHSIFYKENGQQWTSNIVNLSVTHSQVQYTAEVEGRNILQGLKCLISW